ncbi:MAG: YggT family protein [Holosporaceae bacterium]|jgi:uncharacterized protein YggT (Ycf19 family)|nr:YggT family protein [Holosporaceae bacterium]
MDIIIVPLLLLLKTVLSIAAVVIIVDVIFSWLVAANVFNYQNKFVLTLLDSIGRLANIILNILREKTPFPLNVGNIDMSPLFLLLILTFLEDVITRIVIKIS